MKSESKHKKSKIKWEKTTANTSVYLLCINCSSSWCGWNTFSYSPIADRILRGTSTQNVFLGNVNLFEFKISSFCLCAHKLKF